MDERRWQVGELARATGLTVRTLHHWDELGLLVPAERTQAGYRVYDADGVRRLYLIVALRALGLSLEQVRAALDDEVELRPLIERQLEAVDAAVELQRRLREFLERVLEAPTPGALIDRFAGGDPEIRASLERMYEREGPERASHGLVTPEAFDYMARGRAARRSSREP